MPLAIHALGIRLFRLAAKIVQEVHHATSKQAKPTPMATAVK